jgi:RNA polymerase sigma-70 factor, ECF subfamily
MTNWEAIVADDGPAVWKLLWRLLADRADVEECFQETFIAALKVSGRQEVECWPAMLCSLATARAMDRLRQRYREGHRFGKDGGPRERQLAEVASTDAGPAEQAVAAELSERLREALAQLPEKQAEAFYLRALCGWTHRQLGERLRMTENAVGVTIHRARQRLRELLAESK